MSSINLTNHFLIAMPNMADPYFSRTLTYVCEHNEQGALGIVVNRPIDMTLQALFERLSASRLKPTATCADVPVYFGGPVQTDRGFVLHQPAGDWQSTLNGAATHIGLTTSKDILEAVAAARARRRCWCRWATRAGRPASSSTSSTQNAWLTVRGEGRDHLRPAGRGAAARGDGAARAIDYRAASPTQAGHA